LIGLALAAVLVAAAAPNGGSCDDAGGAVRFGDWLLERGDYYRAIGEYQRALYLGTDPPLAERLTLRIAQAYGRGGQLEKASQLLAELSGRAGIPAVRDAAAFDLGYARLLARQWDLAATALHRYARLEAPAGGAGVTRARLLEGLALLRVGGQDAAAVEAFDLAARDPSAREVALDLATETRALAHVPAKSPVLAGVLSAAVPGLGHLYVGEPGMAAAALLLNAAFVWATVESFRGGRPGAGVVFLVGESLWYGGAIFGSVADALRYGREARQERLEAIEARHPWVIGLREGPDPAPRLPPGPGP